MTLDTTGEYSIGKVKHGTSVFLASAEALASGRQNGIQSAVNVQAGLGNEIDTGSKGRQ